MHVCLGSSKLADLLQEIVARLATSLKRYIAMPGHKYRARELGRSHGKKSHFGMVVLLLYCFVRVTTRTHSKQQTGRSCLPTTLLQKIWSQSDPRERYCRSLPMAWHTSRVQPCDEPIILSHLRFEVLKVGLYTFRCHCTGWRHVQARPIRGCLSLPDILELREKKNASHLFPSRGR